MDDIRIREEGGHIVGHKAGLEELEVLNLVRHHTVKYRRVMRSVHFKLELRHVVSESQYLDRYIRYLMVIPDRTASAYLPSADGKQHSGSEIGRRAELAGLHMSISCTKLNYFPCECFSCGLDMSLHDRTANAFEPALAARRVQNTFIRVTAQSVHKTRR